ncbi:MAG: glutamine-hydrolyzing GMP synthase [Candidatus Nitrosothermus koennekii]|nr:MAG: glutamine-hydrolyzing GMP synthase [Candidatus Nitrosothermus koennekii]
MDKIVILDFGSQYAHLICRRIRELGVYAELLPYNTPIDKIIDKNVKGIIFSGGPASVYEEDAPLADKRILDLNIPVLGICYGHQFIVHSLGGKVKRAKREYGRAELLIDDNTDLFKNFDGKTVCWMSHADAADTLPEGFEVIAHTNNSFAAAIRDNKRKIYGIQFHPEVAHTERGIEILKNFVFNICKAKPEWNMENFIEQTIKELREEVDGNVLCATSGGVDSTATALLLHKAIGNRLKCLFVDHGLLRENEGEEVLSMFKELGINLIYIDAKERFLNRLKGITDPEEKRLVIGEEFANVFEEAVKTHGPFKWLAQGTLYPDVIESGVSKGPAARIKSHHNVAGLPDWLSMKVIEPLRLLYKDEVRQIARMLGMPERMINRHPFPGPGLAVRIIGEVNEEKLAICRKASKIVEEELLNADLYDKVWQAFAIVGDDKAVGVLGDERQYGRIVSIRVVESLDAMTADWSKLPYDLLAKMSNRITNEVEGVTWVTYVVSSKPPATIEPQ